MINIYYLYFHRNSITNHIFYVGIGTNNRAWELHARNQHYKNYIAKYGSPIVEIVKSNLTKEEACSLEQLYIKEYGRLNIDKNGILLNKSEGGQGGTYGYKWNRTKEQKQNISKSLIGKLKSENHKQNISKAKKNKTSHKLNKGKPILQLDLENNLIKEWSCTKVAAHSINRKTQNINECLRNDNKTAYGFKWQYKI